MAEITEARLLKILEDVKDPDLGTSIAAMGMIKDVKIDGTALSFTCELTTPACPVKEQIEREIRAKIAAQMPEVTDLKLAMTGKVRGSNLPLNDRDGVENLIPGIKNVILVGSGKGGVGKSTCAVNLALSLKASGASVALLDCDLWSPAIPILTGIREKPKLAGENKIQPVLAHGLEIMSMGFLVDPEQAMIWRGAVLNGIVAQFLRDVTWSENDYLLVDLPPGSGEILLALAQNCLVTGAVLVTTLGRVSLAGAFRTKTMFSQMRIPLLGLVENMSVSPGGEEAARQMDVPFLGAIPMDPAISDGGDSGLPVVVSHPGTTAARAFVSAAEKLAAQVSMRNLFAERTAAPAM